jgi:hypothetical protein
LAHLWQWEGATRGRYNEKQMVDRAQLHLIVDSLPDDCLEAAARALDDVVHASETPSLRERLTRVPEVEEPLSATDIAAIEAGWRSLRAGRGISDEELDRRLAAR